MEVIMKKGLLVVSFGTSYKETREKTIDVIERKIETTFCDFEVRSAFTSNMIIKKLLARDNIKKDTPLEAIEKMIEEGFEYIQIQPLHVIPGFEYEKIEKAVAKIRHRHSVKIDLGLPLLYHEIHYDEVVTALLKKLPASHNDTGIVLMGHGTDHPANAAYSMLQNKLSDIRNDIFIANVEGYPELDTVLAKAKNNPRFKRFVLAPLMIVAGDHAQNDMAGPAEDSFKSVLEAQGYSVTCLLQGLGEYEGIQDAFVNRVREVEVK